MEQLEGIRAERRERVKRAKQSLPRMGEWREQIPFALREPEEPTPAPADARPVMSEGREPVPEAEPEASGSGMPWGRRILRRGRQVVQGVMDVSNHRSKRRAMERDFVR